MKRKLITGFGIIILSILMIQVGSVLLPQAKALEVSVLSEENIAEEVFVDSIRQFLLHFESRTEYESYVDTYSPELTFPNLKIVVFDDWKSKKDSFYSVEGVDRVFDITDIRYHLAEDSGDRLDPIYTIDTTQTKDILNLQPLWDLGYKGQDIVVYDIDTGITLLHEDFAGRINLTHSQSFANMTYGYAFNDNSLDDIQGHGTSTAGVAVGDGSANSAYIGMAPEASLLVGKVSNEDTILLTALVGALEYALALENIDVINYSIGSIDRWGMDLDEFLIRELTLNGVVVSCSAGNEGQDGYYSISSPGSTSQSISVGATTLTNLVAGFSSIGPSNEGFAKPDLLAPGVAIMTPSNAGTDTYEAVDGTSFAAPHIAGAVAVMIDALQGLGIQYDPGLIKAALMASADNLGKEYLLVGAGLPDVNQAINLIQAAPANGTGFKSLMWVIPEFPIAVFDTMPQGFHYEMFLTSTSSTPWNDLAPVVSGNISTIMTLNTTSWTGPWTKNYYISIDIPDAATPGVYEGYVTFETAGGVTASTHILIEVVAGRGKILFPWFVNEWSSDHFLGQYKRVTQYLYSLGYAVNEYAIYNITGEYNQITPELLESYDAVWLADLYNYNFEEDWDSIPWSTYRPWIFDEIAAVQQFVDNGGSLLVDFNGPRMEDLPGKGLTLTGNNITTINELVNPYGIDVIDYPNDMADPVLTANVIKHHAITDGVTAIDHWGGTLTVTGDAEILVANSEGGTVAIHEKTNGARVIVMTTNFIMDSVGYIDQYNDDTQNGVFVRNMWTWLLAEERIIGDYTEDATGATFDLNSLIPSVVLTASVDVITSTGTTTTAVDLTDLGGGDYSYRLDFTDEGTYQFRVQSADDKYFAQFFYDADPPVITTGGWVNNTKMDGAKIDFTITDTTTNIVSTSVKLNGEDVQIYGSGKVRTFIIFSSDLIKGENILHVVAVDEAANRLDVIFVIPTTSGAPASTLAAILGLLSLTAIITLIRRKRR